MADTDNSSYITRYNLVANNPEYFVGSDWYTMSVPIEGITSLTGPVTASGIGSVATTLAIPMVLTGSSTAADLDFKGKAADGSTDTGGATIYLVHNGANNRQLMIADIAAEHTASENGITFLTGNGSPQIFGAKADGSLGNDLLLGTASTSILVQGKLGVNGASPLASAILQADSTTAGVLFPRMTNTQRDAIATPAEGLTIYSTSDHALEFYNGSVWKVVATV